jgi:hypothetical protein
MNHPARGLGVGGFITSSPVHAGLVSAQAVLMPSPRVGLIGPSPQMPVYPRSTSALRRPGAWRPGAGARPPQTMNLTEGEAQGFTILYRRWEPGTNPVANSERVIEGKSKALPLGEHPGPSG